ncbi:hypothetical protein G7Y79_00022g052900 [Physcia stellaris]|nr:hypothetical protein G7Y79_00022g052900 [Physcia stellaris]
MPSTFPISLPSNLTHLALTRFDALHTSGKLNYGPSSPSQVTHNGFLFSFSLPPALTQKPILPPSDPSRTRPGGPFLHPDPDFVLCAVGPDHVLELNKHCILRPMYILHTRDYERQSEDLRVGDVRAAWVVLGALGESIMAIYNCGAEAGASQGHKHLQLFPKPARSVFELYPYQISLSASESSTHPKVPYKHTIMAIPEKASAEDVFNVYGKLLGEMRPVMQKEGVEDYNVVLVREWMLLVPRRHHGREGVECNAVGMMGMVWLKDEAERQGWERLVMTEHLRWLGLPAES